MRTVTRLAILGALSLVAAFVLSACGSDPTATPTPRPTNTPTPTVGAGTPTPTAVPTNTPTPVPTFDADEYFGGRTIKMITGTSPGGGYDTLLRIFGKHAPKYFPAGTKFVVQNIPGAAQLRGLQETLKADPDGLTIGATHQRWFIQQAIYGDVEGLDLETLEVIGSPTFGVNPNMFCAEKSVAATWQDVIDKDLTLVTGQTGPGNSPGPEFIDLITEGTAHHYIDNVYGYGGSAEVMAAFDRGEINSIWSCGPELAGRLYPEWLEQGRVAPLFWWEAQHSEEWHQQLGTTQSAVPHIFELPGVPWTDLNKRAFSSWVNIAGVSRTFLLPIGVDPEIADYWRATFEKVVKDPGFIESVDAAGYTADYNYGSGEEIKESLVNMNNLPPEIKEILKGIAPSS